MENFSNRFPSKNTVQDIAGEWWICEGTYFQLFPRQTSKQENDEKLPRIYWRHHICQRHWRAFKGTVFWWVFSSCELFLFEQAGVNKGFKATPLSVHRIFPGQSVEETIYDKNCKSGEYICNSIPKELTFQNLLDLIGLKLVDNLNRENCS
ncbi:unnamed protein product [Allacma fusca]|uniref:Uncharacterized protein n=1 Tax=Allacma fusca TaxID=39272 RepID=A0A8J2KTP8_9HEXA|nr:unnamed protein product [Allacma fusca]